MLKQISQLEAQLAEKNYRFTCDSDSPLHHVKEVLVKFLQYVGQIEDQVKANQEQESKETQIEEKQEEV